MFIDQELANLSSYKSRSYILDYQVISSNSSTAKIEIVLRESDEIIKITPELSQDSWCHLSTYYPTVEALLMTFKSFRSSVYSAITPKNTN